MAKNKALLFIKKHGYFLLFLAIITIGIFLRSYHFSDWLHFELDQARDANVISHAIENGVGQLPLLGPRAAGTFLRLGPIFYYLGYASAEIFGNSPASMAGSILFFSMLSLPLFYFFSRRYFNKKISLALLALFCMSLFLVVYSRFSWNPNPLIFFIPMSLYSLLRAVDENEKKKGAWLAVGFLSVSISTQLHFLAFIILPLTFFLFLIFKRPRIRLNYWLISFFVALFVYAPLFINEYKTGGANTKQFFKAVSGKSQKNNAGIIKKIFLDTKEYSNNYAVILTGKNTENFFDINFNRFVKSNSYCGNTCEVDYSLNLLNILFVFSGFLLLIFRTIKEKNPLKKDFLVLNGLYFFISFLLFIPIAADLSPRFFLLTAFFPFFILGIFLELAYKKTRVDLLWILIIFAFIISNIFAIIQRFTELSNAHQKTFSIQKDVILKETARVTFFQEKLMEKYMIEFQEKNNFPIFFHIDPRYQAALEYILEKDKKTFYRLPRGEIYKNGNYFLITSAGSYEEFYLGKYTKYYDILDSKNFGTLTVLRIEPKPDSIAALEKEIVEKKKKKSRNPKRYIWAELFGSADLQENNDEN